MTRSMILANVEALIADRDPPPAALRWLRAGLTRHIDHGEPLAVALGIARHCPHGLPTAIRNQRFAACIARAVDALDPQPGQSVRSLALLIGREIARLARRTRPRPPAGAFEAALLDALAAHPNAPTAETTLWPYVSEAIEKRRVLLVDNLRQTPPHHKENTPG